ELLKLNPGDATVRGTVANDLAQAGDPAGALAVVEAGLSGDSVDLALYEYAGRLALAAAIDASDACDECQASPEARALYEKSAGYLQRVFDAEGVESDSAMVGNLAVVLMRLGRNEDVAALAE